MVPLNTLLLALAFLCFVLAAIGISSRINLIGAGLALWLLTILI